jgi:hypothetical protein
MLKTAANPGGLPMEVFDGIRANVAVDRSQFFKNLTMPFYGYKRPGAKVLEGVWNSFWLQAMMAGFPAAYFCIKAFSETDLTEDLEKRLAAFPVITVPTITLEGDANGAPHPDPSSYAKKFSGKYSRRLMKGGHNLPQEARRPLPRLSWKSTIFDRRGNPYEIHEAHLCQYLFSRQLVPNVVTRECFLSGVQFRTRLDSRLQHAGMTVFGACKLCAMKLRD